MLPNMFNFTAGQATFFFPFRIV
uniref:Uncharacterized protein n=1 Tax=Arundo donax TaxID=35708 RepID=A0A0A9ERX5_ARUDO